MRRLKQFGIEVTDDEYLSPGHSGCAGCGGVLALRHVLKTLGHRVVVITCPCCMGSGFGSAMTVASSHGPFASVASWASGVKAGLEMRGDTETVVLSWAGDGGTADIGLQALSAAAERNEDQIFVCYDNEAYMMTGVQRSSTTPSYAWTTTTPVAKPKVGPKKNMMEIMATHHIPYAASTTISYPQDLVRKVSKAKTIKGLKYIHILAPCPTGWRYPPDLTIKMGRLAIESRVFPLYEVQKGIDYTLQLPRRQVPLRDYLKLQGRFSHLDDNAVNYIESIVNQEWEYLLSKCASTERLR